MIIDAHNHPDWHEHNLERFLENMDHFGIDKTWLLSWECPTDEYSPGFNHAVPLCVAHSSPYSISGIGPIPFEKCLEYKRLAPERFILGYAPDPRRPDAIDKLKSAVNIYGVQVCGEVKLRMMYDNPDAVRMFRYCGEAGLPVTLHFDNDSATKTGVNYPRPSYWYGGDIYTLERLLKLCPETKFLGHAPGFWCHISNDDLGWTTPYPKGPVVPGGKIEVMLEKYPNLYCDISAGSGAFALGRDLEYTKNLFIRFQDRILFARDYFDNLHLPLIRSLELPKEVEEKILYKNAEAILPPVRPHKNFF